MQANEVMACKRRAKFNFHTIWILQSVEWQFNSYQEQKKEEGDRREKKVTSNKNFYNGENVRAVLEWYKMKSRKQDRNR